jgi:hypothetical protein
MVSLTRDILHSQGNKFSYDTIRSPAFTGLFGRKTDDVYASNESQPTEETRYLPTPVLGNPKRLQYSWREDYQGQQMIDLYGESKEFAGTISPHLWKNEQNGLPLRLGYCSGLADIGHSVMSASFANFSKPPPVPNHSSNAYQHMPPSKFEPSADGVPTYPTRKRLATLRQSATASVGKKSQPQFRENHADVELLRQQQEKEDEALLSSARQLALKATLKQRRIDKMNK